MPMIDVYAAADLFPAGTGRQLAEELTKALLRTEGVTAPGPIQLNNTAAYLHFLPSDAVHTAATSGAKGAATVETSLRPPRHISTQLSISPLVQKSTTSMHHVS